MFLRTLYLGLSAGLWFSRELDLGGFEDGVFLENILLGLIVTKWLEGQVNNTGTLDNHC